jgi:hypothetical protein
MVFWSGADDRVAGTAGNYVTVQGWLVTSSRLITPLAMFAFEIHFTRLRTALPTAYIVSCKLIIRRKKRYQRGTKYWNSSEPFIQFRVILVKVGLSPQLWSVSRASSPNNLNGHITRGGGLRGKLLRWHDRPRKPKHHKSMFPIL